MKNSLIHIENLSLMLSDKTILDSLSLDVFSNDYISIIGPNGAGKSSLLKCLIRIYPIDSGKIFIKNETIEKLSQKKLAKLISYVPQSDGRYLPFTVSEFVWMGRYPFLSPFSSLRQSDRVAVEHALDITGTAHLADRQLNTLSGGERQTVFLAAALAQGAEVLLLDEPTTFLDPKHEAQIYRILHKINQQHGKTILTVTHDINQAALHSGRIIVLKNGAIQYDGDAQAVMSNAILRIAFDKKFQFTQHPLTGGRIIVPEVIN